MRILRPNRHPSFHSVSLLCCLAASLIPGSPVRAGDLDRPDNADGTTATLRTDKNQYNLFHPTPDDLLRDFSSSRPDQTTGAHSVDAGHFYLETGVAYSLGLGATRTDTWNYFQSTHVRMGLLNNVELELIWSGLDETRTRPLRPSGHGRTDSDIVGATNLTVRTRLVLVGNDSKTFAFSIDPEITLPTQSHHTDSEHVQGDVIFCFSFALPLGFSTTINAQPSAFRNGSDTAYDFGFVSGVTLYHNLFRKEDRVQLYVEYYDTLVTGPGSTDARQADVGVRWRPFKNVQFDAGCNFGVSADAPDYQPFFGVATRF
ncbi:MAG: transporter [Rhodospirillales bacterium]|nr:transporter [Acetobacter sp.]